MQTLATKHSLIWLITCLPFWEYNWFFTSRSTCLKKKREFSGKDDRRVCRDGAGIIFQSLPTKSQSSWFQLVINKPVHSNKGCENSALFFTSAFSLQWHFADIILIRCLIKLWIFCLLAVFSFPESCLFLCLLQITTKGHRQRIWDLHTQFLQFS